MEGVQCIDPRMELGFRAKDMEGFQCIGPRIGIGLKPRIWRESSVLVLEWG